MPPKQWDEEESEDSSSAPSSPPLAPVRRANKFDDEEDGDSDIVDSWDAADDSEVEREKAKKAEEAKAKADAAAAANKKSKAQRVLEHQALRRRLAEAEDDVEEETESERRERLRRTEQAADLKHAEDLFGDVGVITSRKAPPKAANVVLDSSDPTSTVNLSQLPLFNPTTKTQFEALRLALTPLIAEHHKKAHYPLFLQEFTKQLAKDLPSEQIKKIASILTTASNEKLKAEKAADKGGKKSKAQKTKNSLVVSARAADVADVSTYDDNFGDDDFM